MAQRNIPEKKKVNNVTLNCFLQLIWVFDYSHTHSKNLIKAWHFRHPKALDTPWVLKGQNSVLNTIDVVCAKDRPLSLAAHLAAFRIDVYTS